MTHSSGSARAVTVAHVVTAIALLWLAGTGLRITILAVPPVIPLINADFGMTETQVGILSGMPQVLFALAAVPGSLLIAKFGPVRTLVLGLLATGIGSALRAAAPDILFLYAATALTGFGVAIMHPSMPPLVRAWLPHRIGFGSAVFTNGLLVGEVIPVALTLPLILPLVGGGWRPTFVAWAIPVVAIAFLVAAFAPRPIAPAKLDDAASLPSAPTRWWPDWRDPTLWRLGLMFGSVNAMYFATNAFIPDYFSYTGRSEWVSAALTALNVGQLPASLLLLPLADRLIRRPWPYIVCGILSLIGVGGIALTTGWLAIAAAALLGFAVAGVLVLLFALPSLLSTPGDVHRMTAGMFTISYTCGVIVPVLSGASWDISGSPIGAFVPIALSALLLIFIPPAMKLDRTNTGKINPA